MPVKYKREDADELAQWEAPPGGTLERIGQLDPKKRLLIIYLGLFGAVLLIVMSGRLHGPASLSGRPVQQGEGIILEKIETGGVPPAYAFRIEVSADKGKRPVSEIAVNKDTYDRFAVGNRIGLLYQINRLGTLARIIEIGLVVLPEPTR